MTGIRRVLEGDLIHLVDQLHALYNEQDRSPEALCRLLEVHEEYTVALEKLRFHNHVGNMCRVHEEEGRVVRLLACINSALRDCCFVLYAHLETLLPDTLDDLLAGLKLKTLNEMIAALLGAEVTDDAVKLAIKNLATGKTPGMDGLPHSFTN
ncbi:hypothetical protein NDU88_003676 [Pleurodeles waltl]|uniref:Uncharacterized protein n=1 Tax=Pleurodeles waltl TaxID=8319 RepID=A0AAV7UF18_PLEWA|nr:hypothetical protein NDU88_003676 [Pleurodeles waltl]